MDRRLLVCSLLLSTLHVSPPTFASGSDASRPVVEEIVVTAERSESTVSDTSIAITAFTDKFLEDFGIRNQEDLQRFIPSTVIEPYDLSIRGVGRNFRNLGGDPGVATYLDDVYSEDFGIASTENGLYDIERIEVLRGPQGTLYGRSAPGGAITFITKRPTDHLEIEARVNAGSYGLVEHYEMLSGPIVEGLDGRLTASKRIRDGYIDDVSGHADLDNYGDENYALAVRYTPTDSIAIDVRGNERSYRRRIASAGGSFVFDENGGMPDEITGNARNTSAFAFGYRAVDPSIACADVNDRTNVRCTIGGQHVFEFTDVHGAALFAQRVTPGVDPGIRNYLYGYTRPLVVDDIDDIDSGNLKTDTNGENDEFFDHQAASLTASWSSDALTIKYIFGYTDYFYDRTTDQDLSNNLDIDQQFYVSQENENYSHELQFFYGLDDVVTVTSGLFYYNAKINQRGDFYDSTKNAFYLEGTDYGALGTLMDAVFNSGEVAPGVFLLSGDVRMNTARSLAREHAIGNDVAVFASGPWLGDRGTRIPHGPVTDASSSEYDTRTEREALAIYTQAVWQLGEHFALTTGLRWAKDRLDGTEQGWLYDEGLFFPLTNDPATSTFGITLADYNVLAGPAVGNDDEPVRLGGIPAQVSAYRHLDLIDKNVTWRANLEWTPSEATLVYGSVTTGVREAGFNLVFFSGQDRYDPERLTAYEVGYKGRLLDESLQLNVAVYYYDYSDVHTPTDVPNELQPDQLEFAVLNAPGAEMRGVEADVAWAVSRRITLGGQFSVSSSEYTDDFFVVDHFNPRLPESLVPPVQSLVNIKGNRLPHGPERTGLFWGSYAFPLEGIGTVTLLANVAWIDEVYFSPYQAETDKAPAYSRIDLRATWNSVDDAWEVAAFVNNAMDEVGIRSIERGNDGANYVRTGATTDPRLYGVELRYRFSGG